MKESFVVKTSEGMYQWVETSTFYETQTLPYEEWYRASQWECLYEEYCKEGADPSHLVKTLFSLAEQSTPHQSIFDCRKEKRKAIADSYSGIAMSPYVDHHYVFTEETDRYSFAILYVIHETEHERLHPMIKEESDHAAFIEGFHVYASPVFQREQLRMLLHE